MSHASDLSNECTKKTRNRIYQATYIRAMQYTLKSRKTQILQRKESERINMHMLYSTILCYNTPDCWLTLE